MAHQPIKISISPNSSIIANSASKNVTQSSSIRQILPIKIIPSTPIRTNISITPPIATPRTQNSSSINSIVLSPSRIVHEEEQLPASVPIAAGRSEGIQTNTVVNHKIPYHPISKIRRKEDVDDDDDDDDDEDIENSEDESEESDEANSEDERFIAPDDDDDDDTGMVVDGGDDDDDDEGIDLNQPEEVMGKFGSYRNENGLRRSRRENKTCFWRSLPNDDYFEVQIKDEAKHGSQDNVAYFQELQRLAHEIKNYETAGQYNKARQLYEEYRNTELGDDEERVTRSVSNDDVDGGDSEYQNDSGSDVSDFVGDDEDDV